MPEFDSGAHVSYAERLRRKGVQVRASGWSHHTRDQVSEGRTPEGERFKRVRDQLGHEVTERTDSGGVERRDVRINLGSGS